METKIKEYNEEYPVTIQKEESGRWVINAINEGGYNSVSLDLLDIIEFYNSNKIKLDQNSAVNEN